jgi:hypothetical protein
MRGFSTLVLAGCAWLALGSVAAADVQISMHDGRVSLRAKDATVRQILTEWARVGRTQIVNVERITGGPITIEFTNVPEQDALDTLLRAFSGYMVAPRPIAVANASQFDRIIVMPTVAAPRPTPATAAAAAPPPPFGNLNAGMQPPPDDSETSPNPAINLPPALAPIFNNLNLPQGPQGQQPQQPNPRRPSFAGTPGPGIFGQVPLQQGDAPPPVVLPSQPPPSTPSAQPAANPFGAVSTPGMIAAPAQQPGQIPQPQQRQ